MAEETLNVTGLAVDYGRARVLVDVNLEVAPGQVVAVVGPNGVGKTTTLRAISGLVKRKAGEVRLGHRVLAASPSQVARSGVIHVPEGRGMIATLSVERNLQLAAVAVGQSFGAAEKAEVVALFPRLETRWAQPTGVLSGGEQQMVAIARGIVARPKILMVDELSLGLAPKIVQELLRSLVETARSRNVGLLLVDQNVRALNEVADSVTVIRDGRAHSIEPSDTELIDAVYFGA